MEESPPSATESPDDPINCSIDLFESPPNSCVDFPVVTPNISECSETVSNSWHEDPGPLEIDVSTESSEIGNAGAVTIRERASSPISSNAVLNFSISAIDETLSNSDDDNFDAISQLDETLFDGSNVKVQEASNLTELFCSKYNLSDECSSSLYALLHCLLPQNNKLPSGYSHIRNMKKNFQENIRVLKKTADDCLCVLNFRFQLREIVKRNFSEIRRYAENRKDNPFKDFCPSFCPPVELKLNETIVFSLVVFSDGVTIKKSTLKKTLWPVWIQLADLPPKLRMARKNIVLAALHAGGSHPHWEQVVPHIKAELVSAIEIELNENVRHRASFKIRLLISDLVAKSHMLNMYQFNGYYGCHYCTAQGKTIGRTHAYYPYAQENELREPLLNDVYVKLADTLSVCKTPNVVGVKGRSEFSRVIDGLPLTAPVDYMHCVLIGVFPELLKVCYKSSSAKEREEINRKTSGLACPREMVSYSRKIRSLEEVSQFKANEFFNWLFYISPIVFLDQIPFALYSHLTNLVFGIRLLLESSSPAIVRAAEKLLDQFCSEHVAVNGGNERVETINAHCLKHLPDQVRRFGPLFCQSAMSFESANRTLGEVFSGSTSECEVICRRVLQRHKLSEPDFQSEKLKPLFFKLSGKNQQTNENFDREFVETDEVKDGRCQYPTAIFTNRYMKKECYLDSAAYKRSKFANCYVCFQNGDQDVFGKIQYFVRFPDKSYSKEVFVNVATFNVIEEVGPVKGYIYRVCQSTEEDLIPVEKVQKVFFFNNSKSFRDGFVMKLISSFEHS